MFLFFQQIFFVDAWSANSNSSQPKTSGIVVEMPFEGNIYFDNRRFSTEDTGEFPDKRKGDGIHSTFIRIQSTSTKELALFALKGKTKAKRTNETRILNVEIPAISNTEWYILRLDEKKQYKLYKRKLQSTSDTQLFAIESDELSIVIYFLLLGVFIGIKIRGLPTHRYLSTVSTTKKSIPSTLILQSSKNCVLEKIRFLIQDSFVVVIGGSFEKNFQKEVFGSCFFTTSIDIEEIKKAIPNHHILSNPIYIYTTASIIIGDEGVGGRDMLEQILHEHPENLIIFADEDEISRYGIFLESKEFEPQSEKTSIL